MTENNSAVTVSLPLERMEALIQGVRCVIRKYAEDCENTDDEIMLLAQLEAAAEPARLVEEQARLDAQIKELEQRRNALRT